jgi:hypothetical protein
MGIATTTISASNTARQLSDGNDQGTTLGIAGTTAQGLPDKVGLFGAAVAQPAGNAQAAVVRGQACGMIGTFSSTQSPSSILTITTTESAMTVQSGTGGQFVLATGDVVYINKPTSQAGIGVGNTRVSAANSIGITFSNPTAATLTPTASELYSGVILRGFNSVTAVLTPAPVVLNTTAEQIFTVTGVRVGDLLQVSKPTAQAGLDIAGIRVAGNNSVGITFLNVTAATITPTAAQTYTFMCLGALDAVNNEMMAQINIVSVLAAGVATVTTSEIAALTITGLAVTDSVIGVSKDTQQAGLGICGYRVSTTNSLAIAWVNPTAGTLTPTASHVYQVAFRRPAPVAPLVVFTQALTPVSVAANTTAEQTFTITAPNALVALSPVWVNKPAAQIGLGIQGVRVSAANTLAINYVNATAAAITPTAGELYTIGNFQVPFNSADGVIVLQTAAGVMQQAVILGNAVRAAIGPVGLNAIAGA